MLGFCCLGCLGSTWCAVGSGLAADISLGAVNGAAAVKFVRQMAAAAPPLRVLVLIIKALLKVGYIHLFHPFTPSGPSLFTASRREAVDHNCSGTTVMHLRSLETKKLSMGLGSGHCYWCCCLSSCFISAADVACTQQILLCQK